MRVLLTRRIPAVAFSRLDAAHEVEVNDGTSPMASEALAGRLGGMNALICQLTEQISADVIAAGRDLKVIANVAFYSPGSAAKALLDPGARPKATAAPHAAGCPCCSPTRSGTPA